MLYLTEHDVAGLVTMEEAIQVVERALLAHASGDVINNTRRRLSLGRAEMLSLEAGNSRTGFAGHKNYLAVPGKGVLAHFFLYRTAERSLVAMMHANELGRLRTGATSGVAVKHLARVNARRHAVFGAGYQAATQVEAVSKVRPIEHIRVWSRTTERADRFCQEIRCRLPGVRIEAALDDPAELAGWGDIVTVATRAAEPVVLGHWLRPGVLVNAMGSNSPARAEIDVETVARADSIVVDSVEGARLEAGDLIPAVENGVLAWEHLKALSNVVAGRTEARTNDRQIILFESQGLALEDLALGELVYQKALEANVGRIIDCD